MSRRALSPAHEDYLKAVRALAERPGPVRVTAVAARLGVTAASASTMLSRLAERGFVASTGRAGVRLTPRGVAAAAAIVRRHRVIESWLVRSLGLPAERVHPEAEVLEHHVSDALIERIAAAAGDPGRDPHGRPIPPPA